jgi:23S rRNA pseudouridine1911/1915/1917 synthase
MTQLSQRGFEYGVQHLLASKPGTLSDVLAMSLQLKPEQVDFLCDLGAVYLNESRLKPCSKNMHIEEGAYLRVHSKPRRFESELLKYPECVIYQDENLLIVNKPSGLPVHPTVDNTRENLLQLLMDKMDTELFVTHRLDVPTRGLIIFAKNKFAQAFVNQSLTESKVQKIYRAMVSGRGLPVGEIVHYMKPSPRAPKEVSVVAKPGWAICRLKVLDILKSSPAGSELLIELLTGRTHQIRAQLSALGNPVIGDIQYGSKVNLQPESICLEAQFLSFENLNGEPIRVRLPHSAW